MYMQNGATNNAKIMELSQEEALNMIAQLTAAIQHSMKFPQQAGQFTNGIVLEVGEKAVPASLTVLVRS